MSLKNLSRYMLPLLLSTAPLAALAQFHPPTQEELSMTSDPKYPGVAAIYLNREEIEEDDEHYRSVYVRVKILTEKGKELATVPLLYAQTFTFSGKAHDRDEQNRTRDVANMRGHMEIAALSGRTIHPDGTVIPLTTTPADLMAAKQGQDQLNRYTFTLPNVEVGSIIEYYYQLRYDRFYEPPYWQIQQQYPVRKAHYRYIPPSMFRPGLTSNDAGLGGSYMIDAHGQILNDMRAVAKLPEGKTIQADTQGRFILDLSDIPPIPDEALTPPLDEQIDYIMFYYGPSSLPKEYWHSEMQYWQKDVNQYTAASAAINQAVADTVGPSDTPLDKAKKLYALVQKLDNTDFTGQAEMIRFNNGQVPAGNVDKVLADKKGDGKEIAFLYLALAKAAGLDARAVRISSRNRHLFDTGYLNPGQFDSILIGLNLGGSEIDLDPAVKMAPFQTLTWQHTGAGGLAVSQDGKVDPVLTPLAAFKDNNTVHIGKLSIDAQGAVTGALKVGFTGQQALNWRHRALRSGPEKVKTELENAIARQVPDGVQVHIDHIAGLDDPNVQLVAVVQVSGTLGSPAGHKLILPRFFFETKEAAPFPAEDNRVLPVDVHYAEQEQEQITYVLPAGYTLAGKPDDNKLVWETNASYQTKTVSDATSITTLRILARAFTLLDAKDYSGLHDFFQKVATNDQQQLVLNAAQ